jgi:putative ABC transport system permease protein
MNEQMPEKEDVRQGWFGALKVGWFLAFRAILRSSKVTTAFIVFVMMLAFLNLVVVSGLLVGLIVGSFQQFRESYSGEVIITTDTGKDYIEQSPELLSFLEHHPMVEAVASRRILSAQVHANFTDLPLENEESNRVGARITGIDPKTEEEVTKFSRFITSGKPLREGDSNGILIGANLIRKYSTFADVNIPGLTLLNDVDVGSKVRVVITRENGQIATRDFIVQGILKSKVDEISTRMFILDKELQHLMAVNQQQVQEIAIKTTEAYAPTLVEDINKFRGSSAALVQTSIDAIPSFLRQVEDTFNILGNALSSIALVVASITVFIVIFINAVTRRKFIGIMKAIGISPRAIRFSYIFQAFFYGIIGSLLGLILTFGVLKPYFDANPIDFPFSDGILVATPTGAAVRVGILLTVTLVAGYLPASIIVRRNTLDAILGR